MDILKEIINNKILIAPVIGWLVAQIIKTILYVVINKKFDVERLCGSGGMPSSHSSTVCALVTTTGIIKGVGSFEFAMAFVFALIVMYDAMNVRFETGKQAQIINFFLNNEELKDKLKATGKDKWPEIILKEYVGHTPAQVLVGALLGILIGSITCIVK